MGGYMSPPICLSLTQINCAQCRRCLIQTWLMKSSRPSLVIASTKPICEPFCRTLIQASDIRLSHRLFSWSTTSGCWSSFRDPRWRLRTLRFSCLAAYWIMCWPAAGRRLSSWAQRRVIQVAPLSRAVSAAITSIFLFCIRMSACPTFSVGK